MSRPGLLTALAVATGVAIGGIIGGDNRVTLCGVVLALCVYLLLARK